jgi:hypothetical protein
MYQRKTHMFKLLFKSGRNMKFTTHFLAELAFGLSAQESPNGDIKVVSVLFEYTISDTKDICRHEFQPACNTVYETYSKELSESTKVTNDFLKSIVSSSSSFSLRCHLQVEFDAGFDELTFISLKECSLEKSEKDEIMETGTSEQKFCKLFKQPHLVAARARLLRRLQEVQTA